MNLNGLAKSAVIGLRAAPKLAELKTATQSFDSMMVKQLMAGLRKGSLSGEKQSSATSMFQDMYDQTLAESASKQGVGVGKQIYQQMAPRLIAQYQAQVEMQLKQGNNK